MSAVCIFCKIIKGEIPCHKLFETERTLAFLDINPISRGHSLIIPKFHGRTLLDIPNDELTEIMSITKKVVTATGAKDYNILQNNGRPAHQQVDHVHFHVIPKPNAEQGLQIGWPQQEVSSDDLKSLLAEMKSRM